MTTAAATTIAPGADVDEILRRTVRALRSAHEIDALVLARALGISRQSLYNRLNGTAQFLAAEIALLAAFFRVPISDFYDGTVRIIKSDTGPVTERDTAWSHGSSTARATHLSLVNSQACDTGSYQRDTDHPAPNDCTPTLTYPDRTVARTVNHADAA